MKHDQTMSRFTGGVVAGPAGRIQAAISTPNPVKDTVGWIGLAFLFMVFLLGGASISWAKPLVSPVACPAAGPPTDKDAPSEDDATDDRCAQIVFLVPPVPANEQKTDPGGWGALVLTFLTPLDGASFVFGPDCPVPFDGSLNSSGEQVLLKPNPAAGPYAIVASGGPSRKDPNVPAGPFIVTIMYDASSVLDEPDGVPLLTFAFWKAKVTGDDFSYRPTPGVPGSYVDTTVSPKSSRPLIYDIQAFPISSPAPLWLILGGGCALLLLIGRSRWQRTAQVST